MNRISVLVDIRSLLKHQGILLILFFLTQFTIFNGYIHVYIKVLFCSLVLFKLFFRYRSSFFLLAFCISNSLFLFVSGVIPSRFEVFAILIGPIAYYLYGYYVIDTCKCKEELSTFFLLFIFASSIQLWVSNIHDAIDVGIINTSRAILNDTGTQDHSATLQGLMAAFGLSGIAYPIAEFKHFSTKSLCYTCAALLSLFCVIHLVNRTGLVVIVAVLFITSIYSVRANIKSLIFIIFVLVVMFVILNNIGLISTDVLDAYINREADASIKDGSDRFGRWINSFGYMFSYPLGWAKSLNQVGYSHNLWLDVARCTGLVPFSLLLITSIKNYKKTLRLFFLKGFSINGFLVGYSVGLFLSAFVEPVIEAVSTFFFIMCMVWGMQQAYMDKNFDLT